jgi:hypothetical protein
VRLEQLVLFGPGEDFRVHFGPRLTVLAGLVPDERAELLDTLAQAIAGRIPAASVVYADDLGRKVFADRTGATFADTGAPAPTLTQLLGTDPDIVTQLLTLTTADVGGAPKVTAESLRADLAQARAALEQIRSEHAEAAALVARLGEWQAELAAIDSRLHQADDDRARWAWVELKRSIAQAVEELAAIDDAGAAQADVRLLGAIDELRSTGAVWAEASADAAELAGQLGDVPHVGADDLLRVAATPGRLPDGLADRVRSWQEATDQVHRREAEVRAAAAPTNKPDDELVARLALVDQDRLWLTHARLVEAEALHAAALDELEDEINPELEGAIEDAHLEVLRCQRVKDQRFLPGMLGSAVLAVGALLAGKFSTIAGGVALAAAIAFGWWLLVIPRRVLKAANREEEMALGAANAGSWLGLHLKRIDDVMQPADRRDLDTAVDRRATAMLDWEETSGGADPEAAADRRPAIAAHLAATDPTMRAERERHARTDLELARSDETQARSAISNGLEGYGFTGEGAIDLDPTQVIPVLELRVDAGRLARDILTLQQHRVEAQTAADRLDQVLGGLGFSVGDLAHRLDLAIDAVEGAKRRSLSAAERHTRAELVASIEVMNADLVAARRASWDATPESSAPPVDPSLLQARRSEVSELAAASKGPDLVDAQRRLGLADERVRSLDAQLAELGAGPAPRDQRLRDRILRTTRLGEIDQTLPVVVDDVLDDLDPADQLAVLDLLARLSTDAQVIVLSADPVVAGWARGHAGSGSVTLLEADVTVPV